MHGPSTIFTAARAYRQANEADSSKIKLAAPRPYRTWPILVHSAEPDAASLRILPTSVNAREILCTLENE
jgi:hypothetical protein